jgi:hypothetical protein
MVTYTFSKLCASDRLQKEVLESTITIALDHIETCDAPAQTQLVFKAALSEVEQNTLGLIVLNHSGEPLAIVEPTPVEVVSQPSIAVESQPPFAEPLHRTKLDAVALPVTIQPGEQGNIDYQMPSERWAFGGGGLVVGAEPGDWIEAMVVDTLGLIPEAYHAALCEPVPGWPVVNTYVVKQWILAAGAGGNTTFEINTYPLIAKVTPGLTLRTIYHAANTGGPRTVYANLSLTIKL